MQKYVIIVAGGKGLRMGSDIPKQFLPVKGKPILILTIEKFLSYDPSVEIVLVLPSSQFDYWKKLCEDYRFTAPYSMVEGGETRYHSVKNGLKSICPKGPALVAVHDGVRPFVSVETLRNTYEMAEKTGAAIPTIENVDSLRHLEKDGRNSSCVRSEYRRVQTPQTFDYEILRKAYEMDYRDSFTDDASVVEASGHTISLVEGNYENIKITTSFDLKIAEIL